MDMFNNLFGKKPTLKGNQFQTKTILMCVDFNVDNLDDSFNHVILLSFNEIKLFVQNNNEKMTEPCEELDETLKENVPSLKMRKKNW